MLMDRVDRVSLDNAAVSNVIVPPPLTGSSLEVAHMSRRESGEARGPIVARDFRVMCQREDGVDQIGETRHMRSDTESSSRLVRETVRAVVEVLHEPRGDLPS
jgi:hypothetical protein